VIATRKTDVVITLGLFGQGVWPLSWFGRRIEEGSGARIAKKGACRDGVPEICERLKRARSA